MGQLAQPREIFLPDNCNVISLQVPANNFNTTIVAFGMINKARGVVDERLHKEHQV